MRDNQGVPASPSGHSASPEPVVSALRASVPNAEELEVLERAIGRMGWPEIHAFQNELRKGQDVYEDAGGYFIRAIKALFGIAPPDPVMSYREAARALVEQARVEQ